MLHCQEIAVSFSSGGARGHENGHVFVSGEICQLFQLGGEKLLHHVRIYSFPLFEIIKINTYIGSVGCVLSSFSFWVSNSQEC